MWSWLSLVLHREYWQGEAHRGALEPSYRHLLALSQPPPPLPPRKFLAQLTQFCFCFKRLCTRSISRHGSLGNFAVPLYLLMQYTRALQKVARLVRGRWTFDVARVSECIRESFVIEEGAVPECWRGGSFSWVTNKKIVP